MIITEFCQATVHAPSVSRLHSCDVLIKQTHSERQTHPIAKENSKDRKKKIKLCSGTLDSRELESARGKVVTNEVGMYSGMRPECQVQFFFFSLGNCKSVEALKQPGNVISLLG